MVDMGIIRFGICFLGVKLVCPYLSAVNNEYISYFTARTPAYFGSSNELAQAHTSLE